MQSQLDVEKPHRVEDNLNINEFLVSFWNQKDWDLDHEDPLRDGSKQSES